MSVFFLDFQVVDTGISFRHIPTFIKLPVFISVGPEPLTSFILELIFKPHSNPVSLVVFVILLFLRCKVGII